MGSLGHGLHSCMNQVATKEMVSTAESVHISNMVVRTRLMRATDPRDMVYALLGLCTDVRDDGVLCPDYSQSTTALDVYRNLISHSIMEHSNLDLICMRRRYDRLDGSWPSWIPDWSPPSPTSDAHWIAKMFPNIDAVEGSNLLNHPWVDKYREVTSASNTPWIAAQSTEAIATISKSPSILHCGGICVDIIHDLGEPFFLSDMNWQVCDFSAWDEVILKNFGNCRSPQFDTIWHISDTCGRLHRASLYHKVDPEFIAALLSKYLRRRARAKLQKEYPSKGDEYVGGGTIFEAYVRTLFSDTFFEFGRCSREGYELFRSGKALQRGADKHQLAESIGDLRSNVLHRHLIISRKGYIGLGPIPTQKGDMICVLFGCSVPVLIRKVENHHIFVGDCYVHGLMFGEAIDMLREESSCKKSFICTESILVEGSALLARGYNAVKYLAGRLH